MKQQIESLQATVGRLMQDHLAKRDFDTVTVLSPLLSRLGDLHKRHVELEREVSESENALNSVKGKSRSEKVAALVPQLTVSDENGSHVERGSPQTLKISIDWKANKRNRGSEEICEH